MTKRKALEQLSGIKKRAKYSLNKLYSAMEASAVTKNPGLYDVLAEVGDKLEEIYNLADGAETELGGIPS